MKMVVLDGETLNPGDVSWGPFEKLGELTVYSDTAPDEFAGRAKGADVVMVNKVEIRPGEIAALGNCRLIGELATGVNNLDLPAIREAGISVCNVPGYGVADVAQHALALLLEICNNVGQEAQSVRDGEWQRRSQWCYWHRTPICLSGLTMGIIGFGAIGQATGRLASVLGMEVLAASRTKKAATARQDYVFASRDDIFARADVISLHCPLTPETDKIINAQNIAAMKKGAIVINTARGGLVDEEAVAAALKSGQLGAYGADVLSSEPPSMTNPLLSAPNAYITPHMAWATRTARQRIIDIMAENIRSFQTGNLKNRVG